MKRLLRNIIVLIALINTCTSIFAQVTPTTTTYFELTYDASGNRTQRRVIEINNNSTSKNNDSTKLDSTSQLSQDLDQSELFSENFGDVKINVYPNPTTDRLILSIRGDVNLQNSEISIYNEAGNLLKKEQNIKEPEIIDFTSFAYGVYYLKLVLNNVEKEYKIIKIK